MGKLLKAEGGRQGSVGNSSNRLNSSAGFFSGYLALMIMVIGCYILQPIVDLTGPQWFCGWFYQVMYHFQKAFFRWRYFFEKRKSFEEEAQGWWSGVSWQPLLDSTLAHGHTHTSQPIHNSTLLYPKFPIYNSQLGVPWSHTQVNPFTIPNPTLLYPIAMHWQLAFLWKTALFNINLHTLYTALGRIPTGPPQSHTQVNPVTIPKKRNPALFHLKRTFSWSVDRVKVQDTHWQTAFLWKTTLFRH